MGWRLLYQAAGWGRTTVSLHQLFRADGHQRIEAEQRGDLANCLDELWRQIVAGERRFKLYRQLKMYNDPTLNPAVYGSKT